MFNIVGDIHGQADKFKRLLQKLGYAKIDGIYQHPSRKLILVDALINRGPQQREVVNSLVATTRVH